MNPGFLSISISLFHTCTCASWWYHYQFIILIQPTCGIVNSTIARLPRLRFAPSL
ncbi:hypothetical protein PENSPDRAFT_645489 [Peniophora sp. CONT]|nr:hypothetical protein PENSPDRAFT_645489 [Peniophora sp. CONT]